MDGPQRETCLGIWSFQQEALRLWPQLFVLSSEGVSEVHQIIPTGRALQPWSGEGATVLLAAGPPQVHAALLNCPDYPGPVLDTACARLTSAICRATLLPAMPHFPGA